MPNPSPRTPQKIIVEYTTPGGVITRSFDDGATVMRICLGQIQNPHDGLIEEMKSGAEPVPWENLAVRSEAVEAVRRGAGLDDDLRGRLVRHIERTPYYEW